MSAIIMDGKAYLQQTINFIKKHNGKGKLVVLKANDDPATNSYVRSKQRACEAAGLGFELIEFSPTTNFYRMLSALSDANDDPDVTGIIVQLPFRDDQRKYEDKLIDNIFYEKDVDNLSYDCSAAFHRLNHGRDCPCTSAGIMDLLNVYEVPISGEHAVVVGRSEIVGKPTALALLGENATVTICHSHTQGLSSFTRTADILVVTAGYPNLITADMVKPGAAIIDVGINRVDGKLYGDVDFKNVKEVAGYITPVPSGIGPVTVATLIKRVARFEE